MPEGGERHAALGWTSLHKRARDDVICVADVVEMCERVRAEAIENFLSSVPKIVIDARKLQFGRRRN